MTTVTQFNQLWEQAGDNGSGGGGGDGGGSGSAGDGGSGSGSSGDGGGGGNTLLSGAGDGGSGDGQGGDGGSGGSGDGGDGGDGGSGGSGSGTPISFRQLFDDQGNVVAENLDRLPKELQPLKDTLSKYKTDGAVGLGFLNAVQRVGAKGLAPLPEDASEEAKAQRDELMKQINNVPEKPEGYGITRPEDIPEEQWSGDYVDSMVGIMHKWNAPPGMVKELVEADTAAATKLHAEQQAASDKWASDQVGVLKDKWGQDMPKNSELAWRMAKTLGMDPDNDPMFKHASVVMAFHQMSTKVSESTLVSSNQGGGGGGESDRTKALDIINNPANPNHKAYWDREHPQHDDVMSTVKALNKRWKESQSKSA